MKLILLLVFISCAVAHEKIFPNHPEWNNLWPDPVVLNDLKHPGEDTPPNLSGIWTSGAKTARYLLTPSGGGYGSSKDSMFANETPAPPGMAYDVRCITGDWTKAAPTDCGFTKARVALSSTRTRAMHIQSIRVATTTWQATVTFYHSDNTTTME